MKRLRITIAIISILFFQHVDSKSQEGFSIGVQGGAGFSQYFFVKYIDQDAVPVFQRGIVISHLKDNNIGTQLKILFTQKAWQEKFSLTYKKRVLLDYVEVPMLTTFVIGKKKSALVINVGLHASYLLNVDSTIIGKADTAYKSYIAFPVSEYKKFNYGLSGGIGYQLSLGRNIIQLELMYSQSLQNLFDRHYLSIYRSLNQSLYLSLVYKVSLARKNKQKGAKGT